MEDNTIPYCYIDQYGYIKIKNELFNNIITVDDNIVNTLYFNDNSWESTLIYGNLLTSIYDAKSIANFVKHKFIKLPLVSSKQYDLLLTDYHKDKKLIYITLISKNIFTFTNNDIEIKQNEFDNRIYKVGIIDDSITTCKMLKRLLAQYNTFDIDIYTNPNVLLNQQTSQNPQHYDFLLVDIYMPEISGLDFCSAFKANNSSTILIATSGDISDTLITEVMRAGFDSFIAKPINIDKIRSIIKDKIL